MERWQIYYLGINILTYCAFALDKWKAVRGRWRIAETHLMLMGILGGALGGFMAMKLYRHKTKHKKFSISFPILILLHSLIIAVVFLV